MILKHIEIIIIEINLQCSKQRGEYLMRSVQTMMTPTHSIRETKIIINKLFSTNKPIGGIIHSLNLKSLIIIRDLTIELMKIDTIINKIFLEIHNNLINKKMNLEITKLGANIKIDRIRISIDSKIIGMVIHKILA